MPKLAMHWWILIGLVAGVGFGYVAAVTGHSAFVLTFVDPFGKLFLNLLKMIAVPLVLFSLVAGVASLNDSGKLGRIGGKSIGLYLVTTAIAITVGLLVVNMFGPGTGLSPEVREKLLVAYGQTAAEQTQRASQVSITDQLLGIVPTNPFRALADSEMLQVVFFALMLGIALTSLSRRVPGTDHVVKVFQLLSDAIIEMVQLIMKLAPIGVFALLASVVADLGSDPAQLAELAQSLGGYMGTVVLALLLHYLLVYTAMLKLFTRVPWRTFAKAMLPAQLLAFSSSSSAATLPVTIRSVEQGIGVDEEVSSFVLPLGATINMDGTGLYQGVAAVFIANALGIHLDFGQQLQIVLTAALASIGTAAVPGVGIVMLVIVLRQVNIPEAGIALILAVDRPLDMCRTVLNVTGDATVATVVASSEGLIHAGERHHAGASGPQDPPAAP
ncbi:MAG: dicarboxylate/amino acid:cation symporter [Planctomycetes bacterium]|nr:dicarboxylate/amino acid:cation symporter [Planctomycetota bacterium]